MFINLSLFQLSLIKFFVILVRSISNHKATVLKVINASPLNVSAYHIANLNLSVLDALQVLLYLACFRIIARHLHTLRLKVVLPAKFALLFLIFG